MGIYSVGGAIILSSRYRMRIPHHSPIYVSKNKQNTKPRYMFFKVYFLSGEKYTCEHVWDPRVSDACLLANYLEFLNIGILLIDCKYFEQGLSLPLFRKDLTYIGAASV